MSQSSNPKSAHNPSIRHLTRTQKETPAGKVTESAHPARFSPDDKYSSQRVALKKRFNLYLPNQPTKAL